MATLTLSPFGLRPARLLGGQAPNYQANVYYIQNGYATAIGFGDPVITSSSPQGYVTPYTAGTSHILGVFAGLLPYFDTTFQQVVNKPGYAGTEKPPTGIDLACWVIDDPNAIFTAQIGGASHNPSVIANRGNNYDMIIGTPNSQGYSTSYIDATSVNTTSTLPLRMVGFSQNFFLGYDPTLYPPATTRPTNDYIDVVFNTTEYRNTTGI